MSPWARGLIATLLLLALAQVTGIQEGLNRRLSDVHAGWRAQVQRVPFPPDILVVAIDDNSISRLGRLRYWTREHYARLLDRTRDARAVGFDILFTEEDRDPRGDQTFARAVQAHGRVVLPFHQWKEPRPVTDEAQRQTAALLARLPKAAAGSAEVVYPQTLEPPFPALLAAAGGVGYADVNADADGVYRAPRIVEVTADGVLLPHFTAALAALASGTPLPQAAASAPGGLTFGARTVPLDGGALLLRPLARRGGGYLKAVGEPVPQISFVDALKADPETFRDKILIVGETATGTTDIRPTPLDNGLRGVELNAEMLANLLEVDPFVPLGLEVQWALLLAAVGLVLWLFTVHNPVRASLGAGVLLLGAVACMEAAYWTGQIPLWAPVLLGITGATLSMGVQRAVQEHAQKQKFRERFSQYVSPRLVQQIERKPDMRAEDGSRRRVAVLFSDVRGFTPYSEQNPPELVVRQMREYLDEMAASVDRFDGVLDKFIGDAVMALYGPFMEEEPNLSALALASALDMIERLERLNKRWADEGLPVFRIGIGIHVGEAIVGEIGTPRRQQFTALGDTVNLAARLETSTKELQATIIISDAVREEAEHALSRVVRFIDRGAVTVRGREQPVRVYEVRRAPAEASAPPAQENADAGEERQGPPGQRQ